MIYDQTWLVGLDVMVQSLFNADCAVSRLQINLTLQTAKSFVGVILHLPETGCGVRAVAKLDHWQSCKIETKDVDFAWL